MISPLIKWVKGEGDMSEWDRLLKKALPLIDMVVITVNGAAKIAPAGGYGSNQGWSYLTRQLGPGNCQRSFPYRASHQLKRGCSQEHVSSQGHRSAPTETGCCGIHVGNSLGHR